MLSERSRTRQRYLFSLLLFILSKVVAIAKRHEKSVKGIKIRREEKMCFVLAGTWLFT